MPRRELQRPRCAPTLGRHLRAATHDRTAPHGAIRHHVLGRAVTYAAARGGHRPRCGKTVHRGGRLRLLFGRRQEALAAALAELGPNARAVKGSVSNEADLDRLYAAVKAERGSLDIVFANAGVGSQLRLGEITAKHIDETFDINVKGTIFTVQKALPLMGKGGSRRHRSAGIRDRLDPGLLRPDGLRARVPKLDEEESDRVARSGFAKGLRRDEEQEAKQDDRAALDVHGISSW